MHPGGADIRGSILEENVCLLVFELDPQLVITFERVVVLGQCDALGDRLDGNQLNAHDERIERNVFAGDL